MGAVRLGVVRFGQKDRGRVQGASSEGFPSSLTILKAHPFEGVGLNLEEVGFVRSRFHQRCSKEDKKLSRFMKNLVFPSTESVHFGPVRTDFFTLLHIRGCTDR